MSVMIFLIKLEVYIMTIKKILKGIYGKASPEEEIDELNEEGIETTLVFHGLKVLKLIFYK